jgi:hypothetical protein
MCFLSQTEKRAMALHENHHPASALLPTPSGAANQLQKVASEHRG